MKCVSELFKNDADIVFFGAGKKGLSMIDFAIRNDIKVKAIVDNDKTKWGTVIRGHSVVSPSEIANDSADKIIVITSVHYSAIREQLKALSCGGQILGYAHFQNVILSIRNTGDYLPGQTTIEKALGWLIANEVEGGGIRIHSNTIEPYPEVTGYIIPTLIDFGMREYAIKCGRWLQSIQCRNGSFMAAFSNRIFYFDTAQALRGLLALCELDKEFEVGALDAATFLSDTIVANGYNGFPISYNAKEESSIPETVFLYALPQLINAGKRFNRPDFITAANRCIDYYIEQPRFLSIDTVTHFLAYEIEAMIDLGREDDVKDILQILAENQNDDGSVPTRAGAECVNIPGLAQLAVCWYKVGMKEPADKAMDWLDKHQEFSGGFLGSMGKNAKYHKNDEISWAVKYYLDAYRWKIRRFFDVWSKNLRSDISDDNCLLIAIRNELADALTDSHTDVDITVVDIGCGHGRFIRGLMRQYPTLNYVGVDISEKMLEGLPPNCAKFLGPLENIPLPNNYADFVYNNECIEHSVNLSGAISELARICKPGGTIAILDKNEEQWGKFSCPPWERWPSDDVVVALLKRHCSQVVSKSVHDPKNIGLWKLWVGKKKTEIAE
jgi:malonyl-CoA O-methyltransferase